MSWLLWQAWYPRLQGVMGVRKRRQRPTALPQDEGHREASSFHFSIFVTVFTIAVAHPEGIFVHIPQSRKTVLLGTCYFPSMDRSSCHWRQPGMDCSTVGSLLTFSWARLCDHKLLPLSVGPRPTLLPQASLQPDAAPGQASCRASARHAVKGQMLSLRWLLLGHLSVSFPDSKK